MKYALELAGKAQSMGEVPVGAVIIRHGEVIGEGWNQSITSSDATAHAEVMALRDAGVRLGNYRLLDAEIFVTLEPCIMCVGALIHARVSRVIYAAGDPKTGALGGACNLLDDVKHNHVFDVTPGVLEKQSSEMLKTFFKKRR